MFCIILKIHTVTKGKPIKIITPNCKIYHIFLFYAFPNVDIHITKYKYLFNSSSA